jgi:hypothetical protein
VILILRKGFEDLKVYYYCIRIKKSQIIHSSIKFEEIELIYILTTKLTK